LIEGQIQGMPSSPKSTFVAQAASARKRIISYITELANDYIKKCYTGNFMLLPEIYKQQTEFLIASSAVLYKRRRIFEDMQNDTTLLPFGHVP
jgi:hypothetical protein